MNTKLNQEEIDWIGKKTTSHVKREKKNPRLTVAAKYLYLNEPLLVLLDHPTRLKFGLVDDILVLEPSDKEEDWKVAYYRKENKGGGVCGTKTVAVPIKEVIGVDPEVTARFKEIAQFDDGRVLINLQNYST